jgi:uncharacterized membrane protein YgcG
MKIQAIRKSLLLAAAVAFVWWAWKAPAQDAVNADPTKIPYAVAQVIQLEQAKIGDDTVIAYIRNSGNNYNLTANDILYLRQQGVSDAVLTAMLTQSRMNATSAYQPQPVTTQVQAPSPAPTAVYDSPVTYVQPAPTTYYYSNSYPYYYPYYNYYGYYGWPRPWFGWGWLGGGWHWGWGWHGGSNGGWHGGWSTGWRGGGGWHGGGWHR